MVDFPEYRARAVLGQAPIIDVSIGNGLFAGLRELGGAISRATSAYSEERDAQARFRGQQIGPSLVYRDEQNRLAIKQLPAPDSEENRAAIVSARSTYLTLVEQEFRNRGQVLRQQNTGNPDAFREAWRGYMDGELAGAPAAWLDQTRHLGEAIGSQHYAGIQVDVQQRQDANERVAWNENLKSLSTELIGLSEAGLSGDPRWGEVAARYDDALRLGITKQWLAPQTEALLREAQVRDGKAAGISGVVVAEARGRIASGATREDGYRYGLERIDAILKDPAFAGLTPTEREKIRDRFDERFREWIAVSKADTSALDREVSSVSQGVLRGMQHDPVRLAEIERQYRQLGETQKADEIAALNERADMIAEFGRLPISEQQRRLDDMRRGVATPETVKAIIAMEASLNRSEAAARAEVGNIRQDLQAIAQGETFGQQAPVDMIEQRALRLRELGQGELAEDLLRNVDAARAAQAAEQDPLPAMQQRLTEVLARIPTPENVALARMMGQAYQEKAKALRDDALFYGARLRPEAVGPLQPLDWSAIGDPVRAGAFSETLRQRRRQAAIVSSAEDGYPVSPLTTPELETLKRVVAEGNADQKAATAAALYDGLAEDGLAELTPHLFKGGAEQRAFAIAAEVAGRGQQDVARAIFIGQDILAGRGGEKVSVMPKPADLVREYQQRLYPVFDPFGASDPTEAMQRNDMIAVMDRYQALADAATAYYAYLARGIEAPDVSELLGAAVGAVTGGVLDGPQGYKVLAPRPGMPQSELDGIWDAITADDLGPIAPTGNGQRLTIEQIRRNGILRSIGDGEYAVHIEAAGGRPQLYRDAASTVPVIVNLRDKVAPPRSWLPERIGPVP